MQQLGVTAKKVRKLTDGVINCNSVIYSQQKELYSIKSYYNYELYKQFYLLFLHKITIICS